MTYRRIRAMTVLAEVMLVAGCGAFSNVSVVQHQLKVSEDAAVAQDGMTGEFGFRVACFNDDGSVQVALDEHGAGSEVRLAEGEWVDLPLTQGRVLRRMRLTGSYPVQGHVEVEYEEGVEAGVPILGHLD